MHSTKVLYQRQYSCGHFGSLVSIWKWLRSFRFYAPAEFCTKKRRSGAFGFFPLPLSWCANWRWVWPENWEMLQQEARLPSPTVYLTQHNSAPPDWIGWGTCQILSGLVATIQRKRRRGIDVPRVVSIDY